MRLHQLISERKNEIVDRWVGQVRGKLAPQALPTPDLVNHLHQYIEEIATTMRRAEAESVEAALPELGSIAREHGQHRFSLGTDVASLVREYGAVQDCIFDLVQEAKLEVSLAEVRLLVKCLSSSAAHSVEHYINARDEESRRQTARHFAFIAHELRNPLQSAMLAFASMRRRGMVPPGTPAEVVARSHARLRDLIDHSLVELRMKGGLELHPEPISVPRLLEDAKAESIAEAEEKNLRVLIEAEERLELQADHRLLRSAIGNLLRNAIKFTRNEGTVIMRAVAAEGRVAIEVQDECGGLPPEKVKEIFNPFVQIGADRSGFGLGLAISKQVTEAHEGSLRVNDLPGKGCVFTLDLPARPASVSVG